jgi:hypothetical protein
MPTITTEELLGQTQTKRTISTEELLGNTTTTQVPLGKQIAQSFAPSNLRNLGVGMVRGIAEPVIKNVIGRPMIAAESMATGNEPVGFDYPFPGFLGGNIPVTPIKSIPQAIGAAGQTSALALSPGLGGAMYGAGQAMEEQASIPDIIKRGLITGVLGKAVGTASGEPLLKGRVGQAITSKLQRGAEKSYTKALGATTKGEKALAERVVPELAKRKPFVFTRGGLQRVAERKLPLAGEALEKGYGQLGETAKIGVSPILDKISQKQNSLLVNGVLPPENQALNNHLNKIAGSIIDIAKTEEAPLMALRGYRQVLDNALTSGKKVFPTVTGNTRAEAQRLSSNIIRNEIAKQHPSIGRLNAEFSFWKNMDNLLETTVPKQKSILSRVGGVIGTTGEFTGHPGFGLFIRNLSGLVNNNVAWNSFLGSMKSRLAQQLSKGDINAANFTVKEGLKALQRRPNVQSR